MSNIARQDLQLICKYTSKIEHYIWGSVTLLASNKINSEYKLSPTHDFLHMSM